MKTLGLTGGIGSGKSTAAAMLRELGAHVFDADLEARRIMETDADVRREIFEVFGDEAYDDAGMLNRPFIASMAFQDEAILARLNAIVHPRVHAAFEDRRRELEGSGVPLLVHEAALIYESGGERHLDAVAVVDAPEETRIQRAIDRGGATREQIVARMRRQLPSEDLRRRADYVLDNSGSLDHLRTQVERLYRTLTGSER
ncbi:MAG TPA: dephospho-CoA kinase [Rhodothermales bacterium]